MKEIWQDIKGYEGKYQISSLGRIKSLKRKNVTTTHIIKPRLDKNGYLLINLSMNNHKNTFKVHRLVAETFIPNPDNLPCVNHKDENKTNNKITNLEWCTVKYNNAYNNRYKRLPQNQLNNTYTSKPVLCIETGVIYPSVSEASRQLKHRISITHKTSNGYHWKYIDKKGDE